MARCRTVNIMTKGTLLGPVGYEHEVGKAVSALVDKLIIQGVI